MIRPVLTEFAFFLAPFAAYAAFLWFSKTSMLDREPHRPCDALACVGSKSPFEVNEPGQSAHAKMSSPLPLGTPKRTIRSSCGGP